MRVQISSAVLKSPVPQMTANCSAENGRLLFNNKSIGILIGLEFDHKEVLEIFYKTK
jgi:hypothetical protein